MSGATPGSWHAELAEAHAAINELSALVAKQDAELAALKARRCDGCAHWFPIDFGVNGCEAIFGLRTKADFACNAWTAKP